MDSLFKAIRGACSALVWSRGVELARGNAVLAEKLTASEATLRVAVPGRTISQTVKLWPEDEDWLCDCGAPQLPCEHIVAAVIACRRAEEGKNPLPIVTVQRGYIEYRFGRTPDALALRLERWLVVPDPEPSHPPLKITRSLAALSAEGKVAAGRTDLTVERFLADARNDVVPADAIADILRALQSCEHVSLDGQKIKIGDPVAGAMAIVADEKDLIRVWGQRPDGLTEIFGRKAALCDGQLCPIREVEFSSVEKTLLQNGRTFAPPEWPELATGVLPRLEKKIPVEIRTERLPKIGEAIRPRLLFQTSANGEVLTVIPVIVYGDPPVARVDSGRLVALRPEAPLPERNPAFENRIGARLQSELGLSTGRRVEFRAEAATKFIERLRNWPGAETTGNGMSFFGIQAALVPSLSFTGEQLSFDFRLPAGGGRADAKQVLEAWREGLSRVPLLGEAGWASLPHDWLARFGNRLLDLLAARQPGGEIAVYARPDLARLCEELNAPLPPSFGKLARRLEGFEGIPEAELPSDLVATLRPYQRTGVNWLCFLRENQLGALLADDMGLGKTLQTLCVLKAPSLIVVPTSVLPNWQKEIRRFRPALSVGVYHGSERRLDSSRDITLTTYAILRLDQSALGKVRWQTLVLDEAQNIKNPESQVAQAAYQLPAEFRIALSGTPVENRLEDLWSLCHFLNRGLLRGRQEFQNRYSPSTLAAEPVRAEELRAKVKPFLLRRLKTAVAPELPPRTDLVLYCELDTPERELYEITRAAARREILASLGHGGTVMAALECLLRLRQAACHSGLLPGQTTADSSKMRLLREQLEEVVSEGHKALVFSQWTSLLDRIEPGLVAAGIGFSRIDGSTVDRGTIVEEFQKTGGPPVLLMTLKAGGVGLNLTEADHVFLVDPWWNPAAEDQAADRAHRIGQTRPVFVHRLVARETVEEKILILQESKRAQAEIALGGGGASSGITRDDLLALLD